MSPGPTKQFDEDVALDRAMTLFWEKGYASTSMAELQERMGVGARSLYDTFGNKRSLFMKALDRYTATMVNAVYGDLDATEATADAIPSVFRTLQRASEHSGIPGCFLGVAMAQVPSDDTELIAHIRKQIVVMEDTLCAAFTRSKKQGQLDPALRPRDLARFYVAVFQGLNLVSRIDPRAAFSEGTARVLTDGLRKASSAR